jgi:hypothetical protein
VESPLRTAKERYTRRHHDATIVRKRHRRCRGTIVFRTCRKIQMAATKVAMGPDRITQTRKSEANCENESHMSDSASPSKHWSPFFPHVQAMKIRRRIQTIGKIQVRAMIDLMLRHADLTAIVKRREKLSDAGRTTKVNRLRSLAYIRPSVRQFFPQLFVASSPVFVHHDVGGGVFVQHVGGGVFAHHCFKIY